MKHPSILLAPALALSVVFAAAPAHAQSEADAQSVADLIGTRITEILDENEIPGAAAALVVDGETILAEGYGEAVVADGAEGIPFAADTAYYPGSIGKLFTTAAALQLAGEGALDLDADVNDHLSFDVPDTYPGEPITLRHLLTHTSGFEDRIVGWGRWGEGEALPSLAEFAEDHLPERLRAPGSLVTYNNYDMVLAGVLIEEASGRPYEDYVAEHVFAPLGMERSRFVHAEPDKGADVAEGYRYADGQVPAAGRISPATSAGLGVLTSAEDMARFMTALATQDPALGEGVAEQMATRQFGLDDRMPGMGFSLQEFAGPGDGVWYKNGDVAGHHSALAIVPAQGIGFHVSFNGDGVDPATTVYGAEDLVREVLAALGAATVPAALEAVEADLDSYEGEYAPTRTSRSDFTELTRVVAPITVQATEDGLRTTGLSHDVDAPEQDWIPVGDGLFQERDGSATIAFTADGVLLTSADPALSYEKVPWYDGSILHLAALAFGTLVLAAGFLTLTVNAVVRLVRRSPGKPASRQVHAWASWLLGGAALAVLGLLLTAVSDQGLLVQQVVTGSAILTATMALGLAAVGLTVFTAVVFTVTTVKRQWSRRAAVGQALMVAGGVAFSAVLLAVNLTAL